MSFTSRLIKKVVGAQRDHDPNSAPQSAYYPPPPASPYQQLAAPLFAHPHVNNVAPTMSSPPPLPPRQQSSPQQFSSMIPHASQPLQPDDPQGWLAKPLPPPYHPSHSLQPYDPQGWPANATSAPYLRQPSPQSRPISPSPSAPYLRQPSPQPPPISPSPRSSVTPQSSAEVQSMGEPSRQRSARREPPHVRKILSLDGGGVRGLSIITILRYIMKNLNRERGFDLEPWEEFDMIGGTSTGG